MMAFLRNLFRRRPITMADKARRQAGRNIAQHVWETTELRRLS